MYASLDQTSARPGYPAAGPEAAGLGTPAAGQPGLLGFITLRQLAGPAALHVTLWDTQASAAGFITRQAGRTVLPGEAHEVIDAQRGLAAEQEPAYARLLYFDGPRAPEQVAAADRAGRERIWPAVRGLSGLVGNYVLRQPDLGFVVITLTTSMDALEAIERAVMATELLPGEDPALLPGPDRIEIHHVTGYHAPAVAPAASTKGH